MKFNKRHTFYREENVFYLCIEYYSPIFEHHTNLCFSYDKNTKQCKCIANEYSKIVEIPITNQIASIMENKQQMLMMYNAKGSSLIEDLPVYTFKCILRPRVHNFQTDGMSEDTTSEIMPFLEFVQEYIERKSFIKLCSKLLS